MEATVQKTKALIMSLVLLAMSVLALFKLCDWSTRSTKIILLVLSLVRVPCRLRPGWCQASCVQCPDHMNESFSNKIHEDSSHLLLRVETNFVPGKQQNNITPDVQMQASLLQPTQPSFPGPQLASQCPPYSTNS